MSIQIVHIDSIVITPEEVSGFRWSGESDDAPQAIEPILMLNGNYAVPIAVLDIEEMPTLLRSAIESKVVQHLVCCDFKNCGNVH